MDAGSFGRDAFERTAGGRAGFRIPGLELRGPAAEPQEDAVSLFPLGDLGEGGDAEQARPAHRGDGAGAQALQELAAV